jgi:aerobic carbon-monoxide dehydrogenase large subunit
MAATRVRLQPARRYRAEDEVISTEATGARAVDSGVERRLGGHVRESELAGGRSHIGTREARLEDDRLLRADATFVADLRIADMVDMAVVRAPIAHGRVSRVDLQRARLGAGVLAAAAAADLVDVKPFPDFFDPAFIRPVKAFPLARDKVHFMGQPVAAIVADGRAVAEDAAELVDLDLEELEAVTSYESATRPDAPRLYEDWPDNVLLDAQYHDPDVDAVFSRTRVFAKRYSVQRHTAMPMETRGSVARFEHGRLTLWTGNQSPHILRTVLSMMLPIAERDIRVVVPDVGGGFGAKTHVYPEDVLVCWFAMRLGRPVRWIEDRSEHLLSSAHAREHTIEIEAGVTDTGEIQAVRARVLHDVGAAQIVPAGVTPSFVAGAALCGPYRIPHVEVSVTCAVTNKTPSGAYRGFGAPEGVFAIERLIDEVAAALGQDRVQLRRRMLLDDNDLPYTTARGARLDSGSFRAAFDRVVELTEAAGAEARATRRDDARVRVGVGYATYVEGSAPTYFATTGHWGSHESVTVRVDSDGGVQVFAGGAPTGQGLATMLSTLAADALGVSRDAVRVSLGDTDESPYGLGAWGSRSTVTAGGALIKAAAEIRRKILAIAAHRLEVSEDDLVIEHGSIHPVGSDRPSVSFGDIATTATTRTIDLPPGIEPGLEVTSVYDPPGIEHLPDTLGRINANGANGNCTHGAVIEVDVETGQVLPLFYAAVHDTGTLINPTIVEGQTIGGIVQGVGGALYEHIAYDSQGQLLTGNLVDYLLPVAADMPRIVIEHMVSPSKTTPLGAKGAAEGGIIGPPAALANAVADALSEFDVRVDATPLMPLVRRAIFGESIASAAALA